MASDTGLRGGTEGQEDPRLAPRIDRVRSWLEGQAFPFWGRIGVDGQAGFVEHLTLDAQPADVPYKRLRVQARQVYAFSNAQIMGHHAHGLDIARNGWEFMLDHGWLPGGGWARVLGRNGGVLDPTLDLYDQAFALLAIASWTSASEDDGALPWADRTIDVIEERLATPTGVGWLSQEGPDAAFLQNPHMHLLEAYLALYGATGEARFKAGAGKVMDLADSVFFDPASGTLAEYYDARWRRAAGEPGQIIEPGHHHEWVWLLHRAGQFLPRSSLVADTLFDFAELHGRAAHTGLVYDEVFANGSPRTISYRCWPQTEALKALLARFETHGTLDVRRTTEVIDNLFQSFLAAPQPGTWNDRLDEAENPTGDKIPASTFYHLVSAFSELLRLEPQLRRLEPEAECR